MKKAVYGGNVPHHCTCWQWETVIPGPLQSLHRVGKGGNCRKQSCVSANIFWCLLFERMARLGSREIKVDTHGFSTSVALVFQIWHGRVGRMSAVMVFVSSWEGGRETIPIFDVNLWANVCLRDGIGHACMHTQKNIARILQSRLLTIKRQHHFAV